MLGVSSSKSCAMAFTTALILSLCQLEAQAQMQAVLWLGPCHSTGGSGSVPAAAASAKAVVAAVAYVEVSPI